MVEDLVVEDRKLVGRDVQGVVNQRKERDLQAVNLLQRDTTNLRVVLVTVVKVVKVLRGDHHARRSKQERTTNLVIRIR